jgi:hypothetical protein
MIFKDWQSSVDCLWPDLKQKARDLAAAIATRLW